MGKYKNKQRKSFLGKIPQTSIDDDSNDLSKRCKFNFSYFTTGNAGQDFSDWDKNKLSKLLNKLKEYSKFSLKELEHKKQGRYPIFVKYDSFPIKTDFTLPAHIPHQAIWSRFHLENKPRLIGFVLPKGYHDLAHPKTGIRFDQNTFYVVFLDKEHKFYKV